MKRAIALAALLVCASAAAQWDQAISDKELLDPWVQARAVALALPADGLTAAGIEETLGRLDEELSALRVALENAAISIVAKPEFGYDAAQRSFELSQQVGKVEQQLDALFEALAMADRSEVKTVHDSIENLRQTLEARTRFERDVLTTLGSGSKNAIQALAARWWTAADRVNDLREALAMHRVRK